MLNRHSEQKKSIPQAQILKIFAEVCEAVAHMHNQNPPIAHRDLKVRRVLWLRVPRPSLTDRFVFFARCRQRMSW